MTFLIPIQITKKYAKLYYESKTKIGLRKIQACTRLRPTKGSGLRKIQACTEFRAYTSIQGLHEIQACTSIQAFISGFYY